MPTSTGFLPTDAAPYHRERLAAHLSKVLPTSEAVSHALGAVDYAQQYTHLPYADISEPYLNLIIAGAKLPAELLAYNLEAARRHGMTWRAYVAEHLLPYAHRGLPLPGTTAAGLAQFFAEVHVLALRVINRSDPAAIGAVVYTSPTARTHAQLVANYNQEQETIGRPELRWSRLKHLAGVEASYGVMPRGLDLSHYGLTEDFLETACVG